MPLIDRATGSQTDCIYGLYQCISDQTIDVCERQRCRVRKHESSPNSIFRNWRKAAKKKKQTRCPLYKLSVLCLCSLFQHTHMPGHDAAIVMKCNEISQLHARIESQVDRNTMATQQLQVLHNAYLKQNELQQHIDKLHLEYKHLHGVYQQQLFAAELVADSKTHTH